MKTDSINILIVDDSPNNIITLKAVLNSDDYNVISAQSGEEALKYVLKYDFACILLDVQMPNLNGFETAKLIKQRENSKHIPIIFITALSKSKEHVSEGYLSGAVDYILKPFNPEILKSKVNSFVLLYKKQKELQRKHDELESIIEERTNNLIETNEQLHNLKEQFETIYHFSPNLMAIRSLETKQFLNVNESWTKHTGYELEEVKNDTSNILQISATDTTKKFPTSLDLCTDLFNENIIYVTKNGDLRNGLISTKLVHINNHPYIISSITDVTEKYQLELAISRLDRLNLIGEMAAGIAHEIRNPMTTVMGFLQLAKNEAEFERAKQYIHIMIDELKRANEIISEFLTLAKNKTSDLKEENLNTIIHALYLLIKADATLTDNEIVLELNTCPMLLLDEKEIRQLILNISKNGLQAMDKNGKLTIRTYSSNECVKLEISDEGKGIDPQIIDKIGTPFFTTKDKGTGLGMAICYSIAARHNAEIDFTTSSEGTTFTITFPIIKEDE